MLGTIKRNQAENFRKNYLSEMKYVINFLESKAKNGETLDESEAQEAKEILCENIDKFKELG